MLVALRHGESGSWPVGVEIRRHAQPFERNRSEGFVFDPSGSRGLTGAVIFTLTVRWRAFWIAVDNFNRHTGIPESSVAWTCSSLVLRSKSFTGTTSPIL